MVIPRYHWAWKCFCLSPNGTFWKFAVFCAPSSTPWHFCLFRSSPGPHLKCALGTLPSFQGSFLVSNCHSLIPFRQKALLTARLSKTELSLQFLPVTSTNSQLAVLLCLPPPMLLPSAPHPHAHIPLRPLFLFLSLPHPILSGLQIPLLN